jgi:hypothetical protein
LELTEQAVDRQTITNMTTDNLVRVRNELDVSLALSVTGSAANYIIRRCRNAVASELDQRYVIPWSSGLGEVYPSGTLIVYEQVRAVTSARTGGAPIAPPTLGPDS